MDASARRFPWSFLPLSKSPRSVSPARVNRQGSYPPQGEVLPPTENGYSGYETQSGYERYAHQEPPPQRTSRSRRGFAAAPATYILVGINCAVFLAMVFNGVSAMTPGSDDLLRWGANIGYADYLGYGELGAIYHHALTGEWWRLVTAMFVHVGAIHLATNMWCLWNLGMLGEQLVGPFGMVSVYLLTGAAGNLLSTCLNRSSIGAGASGAVFGIAGLLIVLLSNTQLPVPTPELRRLRRSVIFFALFNFVIGISSGYVPIGIRIDNSAHLGGCLCGLALGVPLLPRMMSGKKRYLTRQRITFATAAFILALIGYWIANFRLG
jgi:rhomboid protease GluP